MGKRRRPPAVLSIVFAIAALVFFGTISISREVYHATSPETLSHAVALRKIYSIVAFALVGYLIERTSLLRGYRFSPEIVAVVVAIFSLLIEIAQFVHGSTEGLRWNVIDVICGAAGGWIGAIVTRARPLR